MISKVDSPAEPEAEPLAHRIIQYVREFFLRPRQTPHQKIARQLLPLCKTPQDFMKLVQELENLSGCLASKNFSNSPAYLSHYRGFRNWRAKALLIELACLLEENGSNLTNSSGQCYRTKALWDFLLQKMA